MIVLRSLVLLVSCSFVSSQTPAPGTALEPRPVMQEIPGMGMPFWPVTRQIGYGPCDPNRQHAVGDVDGDGDLDVVAGNTYVHPPRLFVNDGLGRLEELTATHMPAIPSWINSWRTCLRDIDGDGDLDLLAGTDGTAVPPRTSTATATST